MIVPFEMVHHGLVADTARLSRPKGYSNAQEALGKGGGGPDSFCNRRGLL